MTSSLGVKLTPGQRCLLDLLQRKLLNTIQSYARLSLERQKSGEQCEEIDNELQRLKEKIRRNSARQKRFTLEIINGNGNNTIPKESFFEALGLVTKEALSKLNSKTNERRRRTTANPRFSHEAIQAKRALEPLQKRLESRVRGDNKREPSSRRPTQRHQQQQQQQQQQAASNNLGDTINNNSNTGGSNNNNNNKGNLNIRVTNNNQQAALNNNNNNNSNNNGSRTSSRTSSNRNNRNFMIHNERQELLVQFNHLQRQINSKVNQIKDKQESNKKLEKQNDLIRKRGLDIIGAINLINPQLATQGSVEGEINHDIEPQVSSPEFKQQQQQETTTNKHSNHQSNDQSSQPTETLDIWIDMKCDESLDGLD